MGIQNCIESRDFYLHFHSEKIESFTRAEKVGRRPSSFLQRRGCIACCYTAAYVIQRRYMQADTQC